MATLRWIFKPAARLEDVKAEAIAARSDPGDTLARHRAGPDVYERFYEEAMTRLRQPDMIPLAEAAATSGMTPKAYRAKARDGKALLFCVEDLQVAPVWAFDKNGSINALKRDVAREITRTAKSTYCELQFIDYLRFMTEENADITDTLQSGRVRAIFNVARLSHYDCSMSVKATMLQLLDERGNQPQFFELFVNNLRAALSSGWDSRADISEEFILKYGIPVSNPEVNV